MIIWLRNLLIPMEAVRVYLCFKGVHSKNSFSQDSMHTYMLCQTRLFSSCIWYYCIPNKKKQKKDPLCKVAASYKKAQCDFLVGKEPTAIAVHRAKPLVWL